MRRLSGWRGGLGRGDRGGAKEALPDVGHDPGRFESRGWRRALTLRSRIHSRPPPPPHPPCRPCRDDADHQRQKKGPGSDARDRTEGFGTAPAQDPRKSRPGPRNRLQAIALACHLPDSGNPAATAWAGAGRACQRAGQARPSGQCPDLSTDKSGKRREGTVFNPNPPRIILSAG